MTPRIILYCLVFALISFKLPAQTESELPDASCQVQTALNAKKPGFVKRIFWAGPKRKIASITLGSTIILGVSSVVPVPSGDGYFVVALRAVGALNSVSNNGERENLLAALVKDESLQMANIGSEREALLDLIDQPDSGFVLVGSVEIREEVFEQYVPEWRSSE